MGTHTIYGTVTGGYPIKSSTSVLSITTSGVVSGGIAGVLSQFGATILNQGEIVSSISYGVEITAGGSLTNGSSTVNSAAIESSGIGVYVKSGAATITNFGTISGATAVKFKSSSDRLIAEAGSVFFGAVQGGGGSLKNTLELASGVGTITGLGVTGTVSGAESMTFSGFGSYQLDGGSYSTLAGTNTVGSGITLTDNGTASSTATLAVYGTIAGTGTLAINSGTMTVDSGAVLSIANLSLYGTTNLNESLTLTGTVDQGLQGALEVTSGDSLALSGASTLQGLVDGVGGVGTVSVTNGTIKGLAIGAHAVLIDSSYVSGGGLSVGGGIVINSSATWEISRNIDMLKGSGSSYVEVQGTLTGDPSNHFSIDGPVTVSSTGLIDAQAGSTKLGSTKLKGAVSGSGTLQIDAGATLEVDSSVAGALSAKFSTITPSGTLAIGNPEAFNATISGLKVGDTIDLLGVFASADSAWINSYNQLVIMSNGAAVTTLKMSSSYSSYDLKTKYSPGELAVYLASGSPTPPTTGTIVNHAGSYSVSGSNYLVYNTSADNVKGEVYWSTTTKAAVELINKGGISNTTTKTHGAEVSGVGVYLGAKSATVVPGSLINGSSNHASATIYGITTGVYVNHANATVTNFGTISAGTGGTSVKFGSGSASTDRLIVEGSSAFVGTVQGGSAVLELASGTGTITGLGATGTISGATAMTFSGFGSTQFDSGSSWTLSGINTIANGVNLGTLNVSGTTSVTGNLYLYSGIMKLYDTLTVGGTFSQHAGASLYVGSGDQLTLSSSGTIDGLLYGGGTVTMESGGKVNSLAIYGAAELVLNKGAFTEDGAISIGGTVGATSLLVGTSATWTINPGLDLQRGSASGSIQVAGTVVGACSGGSSEIMFAIGNTGTVDARSGTLSLYGPVTGTGTLEIGDAKNSTATLQVGSSIAAGQTLKFGNSSSTLALASDASVAGTISGFATGDTIELLGAIANGVSINGKDQLVVSETTGTVTLQLSGSYTGATYSIAGANTVVTLQTPGSKPPPRAPSAAQSTLALNSAMAGLGSTAGQTVAATAHYNASRPTLMGPKPQLA